MDKANKAVFNTNAQCCDITNHLIEEKTMDKINIVEFLKNCPKGMELDCYLFNGLEFDRIDTDNENYPIVCRAKDSTGEYYIHTFTKYGWYTSSYDYSKCVIFPKGKTTWEGFVPPCQFLFKDGDVIVDKYGAIAIYKQVYNFHEESLVDFHCGLTSINKCFFVKDKDSLQHCGEINSIRLATEEEKRELFDAIKANNYTWNVETKTLEKLQRKFDITILKAFDKVLVRDTNEQTWVADLFSHTVNRPLERCSFTCVGHYPNQCIPYEGNEHLLGTTDDCDKYFKTWE